MIQESAPKTKIIMARGTGRVFIRSVEAAERRVKDDQQYLIKRGGAWFRPGAHGYTMELADAGMFLGKDARGYLTAEGVSLVPISTIKAELRQAVGESEGRTKRLAEMLAA